MGQEDYIVIGKIGKRRGLRGLFDIRVYSEDYEEIMGYERVYMRGVLGGYKEYRVGGGIEFRRVGNGVVKGRIRGYSLERVKGLVNKELYIRREDLRELGAREYYHIDLIGCECYDGEKEVGNVDDVKNYGSCDLLKILNGGNEMYVPIIERHIERIELWRKRIELRNLEGLGGYG